MPGAFDFLDPTAPKPDPDVLMSGLATPEPASFGELSNVSRPTDTFRDRVAQGVYDGSPLSLPAAAYGVGQMAGEAIRDADPGQGAFAGVNAMFLGLPGMRNLQAAGRVKAGARGSQEALQKAQKGWKEGVDPKTVWDDTGWANGKEFGAFSDRRTPNPVAWHGMPDIDVAHYNPGTYDGTVGSIGVGLEDAGIARPGLLDLPATLRIGDDFPQKDVGGSINPTGGMFGELPRFKSMDVAARNNDDAASIFTHELQHGLQGPENIDWAPVSPNARGEAPNVVTNVYRNIGAQAKDNHARLWDQIKGLPTGHPDKERLLAMSADELQMANRMAAAAGETNKFARYANTPHEIQARMTGAVYNQGRDAVESGIYPGDINPFSEEAFHPFKAKTNAALGPLGLTWEDFRRYEPKK